MHPNFHRSLGRKLASTLLWIVAARAWVSAEEQLLVRVGDPWSYLKGTDSAPDGWTEGDFDDSDWFQGPTGIGYGDGDDSTELGDMLNSYLCILTRRTFEASNVQSITRLSLRIVYDDGFIAYLNGVEIGRANMPAGEAIESTPAITAVEPGAPTLISIDPGLLQNGSNVFAVRVHNSALASSDLSFIPELVVDANLCPIGPTCSHKIGIGTNLGWTSFTVYDSISIRRNGELLAEGLDGASLSYDDPDPPSGNVTYDVIATLAGVNCLALTCSVSVTRPEDVLIGPDEEWAYFKGTEAPPAGWSSRQFDDSSWERGTTGIGYGDADDITVLDDMQTRADDPLTEENEFLPGYAAVFVRKSFAVGDLNGVESLLVSVIYDDGFVAYLNGVEIGRVNVLDDPANASTLAAAATEPGAPAQISVPLERVVAGVNVLAFSIHNSSLTSTDLSFIPTVGRIRGLPTGGQFVRGNADDTGAVNITDAVQILRGLFQGGAAPVCLDAADVDDSGVVNITDAVYLLRFLFQGGISPPPPHGTCGSDPTPDALGPCSASGC